MTDPLPLIAAAIERSARPCVTSSFQAECVVLVHMLRTVAPAIPVLFLDTFHHFEETIAYRDEIAWRWSLELVVLRSPAARPGEWRRDTDACCRRHKVDPLFAALESFDTWFTGLRRDQSPSRASLAAEERFRLPTGHTLRKLNPLADWTMSEVGAYARQHGIPLLPLYDRGYTSIGCAPCTTVPLDGADPRSGRWGGEKLECGIHLAPPRERD